MISRERMYEFHYTYLQIAETVAKLSRCNRAKVGAVVVKNGNIVGFGFNGTVSGECNQCEEKVDTELEIWVSSQYDDIDVSNFGNIRKHKKNGTIYYPVNRTNKKGYLDVKIGNSYVPIHRIVAKAFIGNPDITYYNQVNHIDGNKQNNNVYNLEWCTNRYNCEDRSIKKGRKYDLPLGIYESKDRKKNKYIARIYANGKLNICRFNTIDEAQKFLNIFRKSEDFKTFKFDPYFWASTKPEVIHAETNAILKAGRECHGADLYSSLSPCVECCKLIKQAGIRKVYFREIYRDTSGLEKLGIKFERL